MVSRTILVIDTGDLASLTVAALEADRSRLILWHRVEPDAAADRRRAAVEHHAEALGAHRLVITTVAATEAEEQPPTPGLYESSLLLRAVTVARRAGASHIHWARHVGPDAEQVGIAVERANRIAELAGLAESAGVVIDAPLIDLTESQIVELADDLAAPMRGFWPCQGAAETPCGTCPGCEPWVQAFEAAGAGWPWAAATV